MVTIIDEARARRVNVRSAAAVVCGKGTGNYRDQAGTWVLMPPSRTPRWERNPDDIDVRVAFSVDPCLPEVGCNGGISVCLGKDIEFAEAAELVFF